MSQAFGSGRMRILDILVVPVCFRVGVRARDCWDVSGSVVALMRMEIWVLDVSFGNLGCGFAEVLQCSIGD